MTTISAQSILASRHAVSGDRLDTLLLRYPRCIHAEFMTHRMFSRNAASSRAIPVEKMIQAVIDDPFVPLHWGKNQKGMQADREWDALIEIKNWPGIVTPHAISLTNEQLWLYARDLSVANARAFSEAGYHKQIVNRLLEPFMHITVVVSSTNWSNFLALRDHPDAEPHIRLLAREIRKALEGAAVQTLQPGEWHLPFVDSMDTLNMRVISSDEGLKNAIKISVARCASTSYKTVDGFDMTLDRAIDLHDKLVASVPLHASPCEHVCQADKWIENISANYTGWSFPHQHGNFTGFRQYRKMLPNECL